MKFEVGDVVRTRDGVVIYVNVYSDGVTVFEEEWHARNAADGAVPDALAVAVPVTFTVEY